MGDSEKITVHMVDCQATILQKIAMPEMKRRDIAQTYRLMMESGETVDYGIINRAITARWSISGLVWIKEQAHSGRCFSSKPAAPGESADGAVGHG